MEYLNERPIVADDDENKVLDTELNPEIFARGKHHERKKQTRALKVLHRAMSRGKPKVKLRDAQRILRNRASRKESGINWKGKVSRGEQNMLIVREDQKYNPLDQGVDNNEKPLDPRATLDPVMQAFRKRKKDRLQRATHGNAPPIFPDPMDAEMNEVTQEEMFPRLHDIPKLTQGLSKAQIVIWNRAMGRQSSARKEWRSPRKAKKLAKRLADSIFYEERGADRRTSQSSYSGARPDRRAGGEGRRGGQSGSPNLIKAPRYGERGASRQVRATQGVGTLTGSDSYRPKSQHATLVRHQPKRMLEKLRGLIASWRTSKGKPRAVVKNIPIKATYGTSRLKSYQPLDTKKWGKRSESDLKK